MNQWLGKLLQLARRVVRRCLMFAYRPLFERIGRNVWFDPFGEYSFENISIGDDCYLGPGTKILASETKVTIGSKVMFGPDVLLIGGDHNSSVVGKYMFDVKNKRPEDDQPITIETDVWIGARVTILKGVRIGTGSIVAAGAVVSKSVPDYSIAAGIPAKVIKPRWTESEIATHKAQISQGAISDAAHRES